MVLRRFDQNIRYKANSKFIKLPICLGIAQVVKHRLFSYIEKGVKKLKNWHCDSNPRPWDLRTYVCVCDQIRQKFKGFCLSFDQLGIWYFSKFWSFSIWKYFELTFANLKCYWANFRWCKWSKLNQPSGPTVLAFDQFYKCSLIVTYDSVVVVLKVDNLQDWPRNVRTLSKVSFELSRTVTQILWCEITAVVKRV